MGHFCYPDDDVNRAQPVGPNAKVGACGENTSNDPNPDFDRTKDMPNGLRRQETIDRMIAMVRRDALWSWNFHAKVCNLHHTWLHNVKPNLMTNNKLKYWPIGLMAALLVVTVVPAWKTYRRRERSTAL